LFDLDLDSIPSGPFDTSLWWVLIGVVIALLFTLQALETAVEGTWPHQRRDNEYVPGARGVKASWGFAAILIVPGALAMMGILIVMIWQDIATPDGINLGGWLLGLGWLMFLIFGLNLFGLGRLLGTLGMIGPLAIGFVLLVADALLIVTFLDVLPEWSIVVDGVKELIENLLPFVEFEDDSATR
jgi:hypothetical protein